MHNDYFIYQRFHAALIMIQTERDALKTSI